MRVSLALINLSLKPIIICVYVVLADISLSKHCY